jgi:hypothetical protein
MFHLGDKVRTKLDNIFQAYLDNWSVRFVSSKEIGTIIEIQEDKVLVEFGFWTMPMDLKTATKELEVL